MTNLLVEEVLSEKLVHTNVTSFGFVEYYDVTVRCQDGMTYFGKMSKAEFHIRNRAGVTTNSQGLPNFYDLIPV
jgi:hypothetical protein